MEIDLALIGMEKGKQYETIISTVNDDNVQNAAPIGVICSGRDKILNRIFKEATPGQYHLPKRIHCKHYSKPRTVHPFHTGKPSQKLFQPRQHHKRRRCIFQMRSHQPKRGSHAKRSNQKERGGHRDKIQSDRTGHQHPDKSIQQKLRMHYRIADQFFPLRFG